MRIALLQATDAVDFRDLMLEAYRDYPMAFTSSFEERVGLPMNWWEARLTGKNLWIFGARTPAGPLAGCVGLSLATGAKTSHKASLFGMYVRPASAGNGVGSELITALMSHLEGYPQITAITLTVSAGNAAAMALYKKFGFVEYGVEPCAVRLDGRYIAKHELWKPLADGR
jgi:ribosomal protein S18 acetylase RimI-like enzyme